MANSAKAIFVIPQTTSIASSLPIGSQGKNSMSISNGSGSVPGQMYANGNGRPTGSQPVLTPYPAMHAPCGAVLSATINESNDSNRAESVGSLPGTSNLLSGAMMNQTSLVGQNLLSGQSILSGAQPGLLSGGGTQLLSSSNTATQLSVSLPPSMVKTEIISQLTASPPFVLASNMQQNVLANKSSGGSATTTGTSGHEKKMNQQDTSNISFHDTFYSSSQSQTQFLKSIESFKVLTECPLIVMLLFQLYPRFIQRNIPQMLPLMMNVLSLHVPPTIAKYHKIRFKEFIASQVSFFLLSFDLNPILIIMIRLKHSLL